MLSQYKNTYYVLGFRQKMYSMVSFLLESKNAICLQQAINTFEYNFGENKQPALRLKLGVTSEKTTPYLFRGHL